MGERNAGDFILSIIETMHPVKDMGCGENSSSLFQAYLFTLDELRDGAVVVHVIITLYVFIALAIICEHYFVPAIEMFAKDIKYTTTSTGVGYGSGFELTKDTPYLALTGELWDVFYFRIPPNVAGASLMASAASIPQLANTLIGIYIAHDDIGVGAVCGSAFFSVLLIPGICGLAVKGAIQLRCLAMTRDCVTYIVASVVLGIIIIDGRVWWYESVILIMCYFIYLTVLMFNSNIESCVKKYDLDEKSTCCAFLACKRCAQGNKTSQAEKSALVSSDDDGKSYEATGSQKVDAEKSVTKSKETEVSSQSCPEHSQSVQIDPDEREYHSPVALPKNKWWLPVWILLLPANALFLITVPDPRRPGCWRRLYGLTLLISVLYIALTSYVLIWMITVIGDTLGASVTVMGMTLLAVGSSLPDAFNSVFCVRDGYGEMALANTMGSINFDILFCLGLPWLLKCLTSDVSYIVLEENLTLVTLCLLFSGLLILITYICTGFQINIKISIFFLIAYVAFMVITTYFMVATEDQLAQGSEC